MNSRYFPKIECFSFGEFVDEFSFGRKCSKAYCAILSNFFPFFNSDRIASQNLKTFGIFQSLTAKRVLLPIEIS
ncbi:hypothetical protein [Leptospira santarosai]|uniref:hypothetical protein n=1 Tax=Leptospira santarosai TaxID=28183 RepID=UPI000345D1A9|nr:hypothetical protein [Leptospira santarosai]MDI7156716.1 hypothetical protein [Leptospira santarosai]